MYKRDHKQNNYNFLGFSLVELMVVVAILGILVALVILSFNLQLFKGNDSKRKNDLDRIKIAVEEYEKDHNCYPKATLMNKCGSDETIPIHPYLNNVPCDPISGEAYAYETDDLACPTWFRLYSILQNTKDAKAILGIGPGNIYNYYVSSGSAPNVVSSIVTTEPSPSGTAEFSNTPVYGCTSGLCIRVDTPNGLPVCQPTYDASNCYNQCGSPTNPANECVTH